MTELSGRAWCDRFPTSHSTDDLSPEFKPHVVAFLAALHAAGASVSISATYRPAERAYLMHYAWEIARKDMDPATVPAMAGVAIQWDHANAGDAAEAMVEGFSMAFPAVLVSRHTQRNAIDMTIHWTGTMHVKDANGVVHSVTRQQDLWAIGASYGVHKLASDPPHWSIDGH